MKKYIILLLVLFLVFSFVACFNGKEIVQETTTTDPPTLTFSTTEKTTVTKTTEPSFEDTWPTVSGGYPSLSPVNSTPAVVKTIKWMNDYVMKNITLFDGIIEELREKVNDNWSIYNSGDGFLPEYRVVPDEDWELLSENSKSTITKIDNDFRMYLGKSRYEEEYRSRFFVSRNTLKRSIPEEIPEFSGKLEFSYIINEEQPGVALIYELAYLGEGFAPSRWDMPYEHIIGDWYYYCNEW